MTTCFTGASIDSKAEADHRQHRGRFKGAKQSVTSHYTDQESLDGTVIVPLFRIES